MMKLILVRKIKVMEIHSVENCYKELKNILINTSTRSDKNKYNEDTGELVNVGIFKCLYHSSHNHEEMQNADSGKYANDKIEMLLTEYTDKLKIGDICKLNNSEYKISDIVNFNQTNNFIDLKLEVLVDVNI